MIALKSKADCCGCGACEQICPHSCIKLIPDGEGFAYPVIDKETCVDCHLCEKVCPILNVTDNKIPNETPTFAAYNLDERERITASSGGVFHLLAAHVIKNEGIVCGAAFDEDFRVIHTCIDSIEDIEKLKRSKYVQSRTLDVYTQIRGYLKEGRKVLFVGTPCQVAGLKHFLRKDDENLFTVDFACHGVPSPYVWEKYLLEKRTDFAKRNGIKDVSCVRIKDINFRDKIESWRRYHLSISLTLNKSGGNVITPQSLSETYSKYAWEDEYMLSFLNDYSIRPSCYHCHFRNGKCRSDLSLGDFWRINEQGEEVCEVDEVRGTSVVHLHTEKGVKMFDSIDCYKKEYSFEQAYNWATISSWPEPRSRFVFFLLINKCSLAKTLTYSEQANKCLNYFLNLLLKLKNNGKNWSCNILKHKG